MTLYGRIERERRLSGLGDFDIVRGLGAES